jgi:hypothetical protein
LFHNLRLRLHSRLQLLPGNAKAEAKRRGSQTCVPTIPVSGIHIDCYVGPWHIRCDNILPHGAGAVLGSLLDLLSDECRLHMRHCILLGAPWYENREINQIRLTATHFIDVISIHADLRRRIRKLSRISSINNAALPICTIDNIKFN